MSAPIQRQLEEVELTGHESRENANQNDTTCIQIISSCGHAVTSCAKDKDHRKLAIMSIICGISCIGIVALINSVKARERRKSEHAQHAHYSNQAKKFGIISIAVWVAIIFLTPMLLALLSYLLTMID